MNGANLNALKLNLCFVTIIKKRGLHENSVIQFALYCKKKASTQPVFVVLGENHFENNTAKVLTHVLQKIQIKPDGIFWKTISQQYIDDGTAKPYSPQDLSLLKELSEIAYWDRYQYLAALSKLAPLMGCSTPKESYFRHFPEESFASSRSLVDLHTLLHQTRQYHFELVQSGWALEQLKSVH